MDAGALTDLLDALSDRVTTRTVTGKIWESVVEEVADLDRKNKSSDAWSDLKIVNAFSTPKLVYEVMRKNFTVRDSKCSLFGSAEDKVRN